jgi:hypothetical protein
MKNPKIITTIQPGATVKLPTYIVTEEGIVDGDGVELKFCKGDKSNPEVFRQEGVFTETILQAAKEYLESVNKGELSTRETSTAITKIDEALMWLNKRAEDRKLREVQGTYKQ